MNATKTGVDNDNARRVRVVIYARTNRPDSVLSIQDQCKSVREYAALHDMEVVRVYEDAGKSGASLEGRDAMKRLLAEAASPNRDFDVILVYDWSRWGRFLDAAGTYYEHLCRRAGVELRACNEPPAHDGQGQISSGDLTRARLIADSRKAFGKVRAAGTRQSRMTGDAIVRAFRREQQKQRQALKKAELCETRLFFSVNALKALFGDENFVNLLRAEGLESLPEYLAQKIKEEETNG